MNTENKLKIDNFTKALAECINQAQCAVVDPMAHAEIWKKELLELAKGKEPVSEQKLSNVERIGKNWKEPVSEIDFEQELYKAFGHVKDFTLCLKIARRFYEMGKNSQEPVSEELGEYINELSKQFPEVSFAKLSRIAVRVSKWQIEQFEKNRLKHCNSITNEQAELEQGFIDQHLDKHQRMPTFLDAIEYGMRLQKEQINEVLLSEVLPCFMHGGEADEVVAKLDEVLNKKK